mgnify:CR=1 FL=1|jgi:hypothetical protein
MNKYTKKLTIALLLFSFIFNIAANTKNCSAYSQSDSFHVTENYSEKISIINFNHNNAVTVTYSAYPNDAQYVARVEIYKDGSLTGGIVASSTFNKYQQHTETFVLPAGATYYAKISSATGNAFSGIFTATY